MLTEAKHRSLGRDHCPSGANATLFCSLWFLSFSLTLKEAQDTTDYLATNSSRANDVPIRDWKRVSTSLVP